jgi:hypothetical protein
VLVKFSANVSAAVAQETKNKIAAFMEFHGIHESEAIRRLLDLGLAVAPVPLDGDAPSSSMSSQQP